MKEIIKNVTEELIQYSDPVTQEKNYRFFKESFDLYGVKSANIRAVSKKHYSIIKDFPKDRIFELCEKLFSSMIFEQTIIASDWAHKVKKFYSENDFYLFEKWLSNYVNNWATCDTFGNHAIGDFISMYPQYLENLKNDWTKSENRWMRRGAAISLVTQARRGEFLDDILKIADLLLLDEDDLVRKGYGWMLKEASKVHLHEIYNFVLERKKIMPRTSLRYAIEKMPEEMRRKAMEK
jgi:3-methyladenine DNA glycosylase AlkD